MDDAHQAGAPKDAYSAGEWTPPTWDEVVRNHSARVYRLAYRLTGNVHDAEDLTQEVFVRVFRSLSSYTPGTFEGWLHRITTNLFLDMARRRQRIRFEGLADDAAERLNAARDCAEALPTRRRRRRTMTAISSLTSRRPSTPSRRSSGPRSCCATSKDCPTKRSRRRSASSWAPSAAVSIAAVPSCVRRSSIVRHATLAAATNSPRR